MTRHAKNIRRELVLSAFMDWFGIEKSAAEALVSLWESGRAMNCMQLGQAINPAKPLLRNSVEVRICILRKAMEAEAIDTLPGGAYVLTDQGHAECREALASAAQTILAEVGEDAA